MIGIVARGVLRFAEHPVDALRDMRDHTPSIWTGLTGLVAAMLVMVVIDLTYGPFAFPHTLEPGGKRDIHPFALAAVEITRVLGYAAVVWMGVRFILRAPVTPAEAVWMTVPYAIALVLFELLQAATWLVFLLTSVNLYGPFFVIGFGAKLLVLVVAVRTLAEDRDWLTCLPIVIVAFVLGTYVPYMVVPIALALAAIDRLRRV